MRHLERALVPTASTRKRAPVILLGVTHPQTCVILGARLRSLRRAGFRVLLVSSPGELLDQTAAQEHVECIPLNMRRGIALWADLVSLYKMWQLIGRYRPQIVEFSTPKAGLLGTVAAWLREVPSRVYLLRGLRLQTEKGPKRKLLLALERIAAACAHTVLCNSESLRAEALSLGIASPAKLRVLGHGSSNGVDVEHYQPGPSRVRETLGIPPDAPVVGFVGRLTRDKGLPELMQAFKRIVRAEPRARLLLVGWFDEAEDALDGAMRTQILCDEAVDCTGFVIDPAPYYRAMDVLVLPTWREGFPNVALEAAATGVPVVTTERTGSRDAVVPEVTGLLIPAGYPSAICEAVMKILRDPERRQQMGRAARAWVLENYLESSVLGATTAYYRELVDDVAAGGRQRQLVGLGRTPQPFSSSPPNKSA